MKDKTFIALFFVLLTLLPIPYVTPVPPVVTAAEYSVTATYTRTGTELEWKGSYDLVFITRIRGGGTEYLTVRYKEDGNTFTVPSGGIDIDFILEPGDTVKLWFYAVAEDNVVYLGTAETEVIARYYLPVVGKG